MTTALLHRLLFPRPSPTYAPDSDGIIWIPDIHRGNRSHHDDFDTSALQSRFRDDPTFRIPTLFLRSNNAFARYVVIFFHGNAEDLGTSRDFCKNLRTCFQCHAKERSKVFPATLLRRCAVVRIVGSGHQGLLVLAPEMPGYGLGNRAVPPSEDTMVEYARSCLDFALHELRWPLDSIIVLGRSIGCVSAIALAAAFPAVGGLCLVSGFYNLQKVVQERVGGFMAGYVAAATEFNNGARIRHVLTDALIVHGQRDTVVLPENGSMLFDSCGSDRKLLVEPQTMSHNTALFSDPAFFMDPMLQFFKLPDYVFEFVVIPDFAEFKLRMVAAGEKKSGLSSNASGTDPVVHAGANGRDKQGRSSPRRTSGNVSADTTVGAGSGSSCSSGTDGRTTMSTMSPSTIVRSSPAAAIKKLPTVETVVGYRSSYASKDAAAGPPREDAPAVDLSYFSKSSTSSSSARSTVDVEEASGCTVDVEDRRRHRDRPNHKQDREDSDAVTAESGSHASSAGGGYMESARSSVQRRSGSTGEETESEKKTGREASSSRPPLRAFFTTTGGSSSSSSSAKSPLRLMSQMNDPPIESPLQARRSLFTGDSAGTTNARPSSGAPAPPPPSRASAPSTVGMNGASPAARADDDAKESRTASPPPRPSMSPRAKIASMAEKIHIRRTPQQLVTPLSPSPRRNENEDETSANLGSPAEEVGSPWDLKGPRLASRANFLRPRTSSTPTIVVSELGISFSPARPKTGTEALLSSRGNRRAEETEGRGDDSATSSQGTGASSSEEDLLEEGGGGRAGVAVGEAKGKGDDPAEAAAPTSRATNRAGTKRTRTTADKNTEKSGANDRSSGTGNGRSRKLVVGRLPAAAAPPPAGRRGSRMNIRPSGRIQSEMTLSPPYAQGVSSVADEDEDGDDGKDKNASVYAEADLDDDDTMLMSGDLAAAAKIIPPGAAAASAVRQSGGTAGGHRFVWGRRSKAVEALRDARNEAETNSGKDVSVGLLGAVRGQKKGRSVESRQEAGEGSSENSNGPNEKLPEPDAQGQPTPRLAPKKPVLSATSSVRGKNQEKISSTSEKEVERSVQDEETSPEIQNSKSTTSTTTTSRRPRLWSGWLTPRIGVPPPRIVNSSVAAPTSQPGMVPTTKPGKAAGTSEQENASAPVFSSVRKVVTLGRSLASTSPQKLGAAVSLDSPRKLETYNLFMTPRGPPPQVLQK